MKIFIFWDCRCKAQQKNGDQHGTEKHREGFSSIWPSAVQKNYGLPLAKRVVSCEICGRVHNLLLKTLTCPSRFFLAKQKRMNAPADGREAGENARQKRELFLKIIQYTCSCGNESTKFMCSQRLLFTEVVWNRILGLFR